MKIRFVSLCLVWCSAVYPQADWWNTNWHYRLKAVIQERTYLGCQKIIQVSFPIKGSIKRDGSDVRVVDSENKLLPCQVQLEKNQTEAVVTFLGENGYEFTIYYGNPDAQKPAETFSFKAGRVLVNDYLHPEARTTGSWSWVSQPRLYGRLAHTEIENTQSFHGAAIIPAIAVSPSDTLIQYVLVDEKNPTRQLMLEVWSGRNRFFFYWGEQHLEWRGLNPKKIGELPQAGSWQKLVLPLSEISGLKEITGLTFYHARGNVVWDLTAINEIPVPAQITSWEELGQAMSPYFLAETSGPFKFGEDSFAIIHLRSLNHIQNCLWTIEGKQYSGSELTLRLTPGKNVVISLKVTEELGQGLEYVRELSLPEGKPEEIKLELETILHPTFVYPGQPVLISHRLSSLTALPLPLSISVGGKKEEIILLPRPENTQIFHHQFTSPDQKHPFSFQVNLADLNLDEKQLVFLPLAECQNLTAEGPFLFSPEKKDVLVVVPEKSYPPGGLPLDKEMTLAFLGEVPGGLPQTLSSYLQQKGLKTKLVAYPSPKKKSYYLLSLFSLLTRENFSADLIIIFPDLESLLRKLPLSWWSIVIDAIVSFLRLRSSLIILCSPFPSVPDPENFRGYAEELSRLAEKRNIPFVDLYSLFTARPDWKNFFLLSDGVYTNFPKEEAIDQLVRVLAEKILCCW
ncbi:MAG: hypothetical protein NC911_08825 [Candidatus Omnitrophica bacterium]|nr:hypothetical protein [Candidatus Omnitrophota bacterium]